MSNEGNASKIIQHIFKSNYKKGLSRFEFDREDIGLAADEIGIPRPKNLGGVIYTFKHSPFPDSITKTAPEGKWWWLTSVGKGKYCFSLNSINPLIEPNSKVKTVKIPESTPGLVKKYSKQDEQALLAIIRYNRILDLFLGLTCYSLQNHLRTTVEDIGQIEIDELYIGIDKKGKEYIIPVEAKGSREKIGISQIEQNIKFCDQDYPSLSSRIIACQFIDSTNVAIFEFRRNDDGVPTIVNEAHYELQWIHD